MVELRGRGTRHGSRVAWSEVVPEIPTISLQAMSRIRGFHPVVVTCKAPDSGLLVHVLVTTMLLRVAYVNLYYVVTIQNFTCSV